ncbi:hypothetical protein [Hydrogenimonas sp.]
MAISPLTNIIFVNQNMQVAASVQTMQFNRYDIQNAAAQAIVNEKEKVIEETRPAEESEAIDPDRDHERQEAREREKERPHPSPRTNHERDKGFTVDEDGTPHVDIHV